MPQNLAELTEALRICRDNGQAGHQQVDADMVGSLLQQLAEFPIFFLLGEVRNVGHVVASVMRLRGGLCSIARDLPVESELEAMVIALSYAAKQFLAIAELIESEIREYLQQIDTRIACHQTVDAEALRDLATWRQTGYPDRIIFGNLDLGLSQLPLAVHRSLFVLAAGGLRAQYAQILAAVSGLFGVGTNVELERARATISRDRSLPNLLA